MARNKGLGIVMVTIGIILAVALLLFGVYANYRYENEVMYSWNLADKTSTLDAKSNLMDDFISNLEKQKFSEYNALVLKTPDNNVQNNINAVKTLKTRLDEIKDLDPESFAYQTAIQQITAQEQGEAEHMLEVIYGGWLLKNYPFLWKYINLVLGLVAVVLIWRGYENVKRE